MEWFYAPDGEQRGPVSEAQLEALISAGTIKSDTLLWNKEMPDWQPLSVVRPAAVPAGDLPPVINVPGTRCIECGNSYAQSDMIVLNNSWVCATCKPRFLQRMMEGGAAPSAGGMMWRKKKEVVLGKETPFPDRCVRCNAPANGFKLKRELSWHPPAYYILVIVSLLIYIIVAMIVRKKATVHIGLCEAHRAARKRTILIASLTAALGLVLLITGAVMENGILAVVGIFMLLGGGIYGAVAAPIISATKIEHDVVTFKGAGQQFLDTLPEWTGR